MTLPAALAWVACAAVIGNRIFSIFVGLLLKVPVSGLLAVVLGLDVLQIPLYYWIYEHGTVLAARWPKLARGLERLQRLRPRAAWVHSMGAFGVFVIAVLPGFGGGIWSAVLLAHSLKMRKVFGAVVIICASAFSVMALYCVLDPLVSLVRYFIA